MLARAGAAAEAHLQTDQSAAAPLQASQQTPHHQQQQQQHAQLQSLQPQQQQRRQDQHQLAYQQLHQHQHQQPQLQLLSQPEYAQQDAHAQHQQHQQHQAMLAALGRLGPASADLDERSLSQGSNDRAAHSTSDCSLIVLPTPLRTHADTLLPVQSSRPSLRYTQRCHMRFWAWPVVRAGSH